MNAFLLDAQIKHELTVPMGPQTWYGVGGNARFLAHPSSMQQLSALAAAAHEHKIRSLTTTCAFDVWMADGSHLEITVTNTGYTYVKP